MGNPTSQSHDLNNPFQADTQSQKRALSYATTIKMLFDEVMTVKQPADRILANYFREHKKHGSKDRKVIRESLFGVFRWWGWLSNIAPDLEHNSQVTADWFSILTGCAYLENHSWKDIVTAWQTFSAASNTLDTANISPLESIADKQALLARLYPALSFDASALLPEWFWQVCPLEENQQLALIEAMSSRPPIWARAQGINTAQASAQLQAQGIDATDGHVFSDALNLGHKSMNLNEVALYKEGKLEIQDLASQVIGQICAPKKDELWWDTCSGAGGKSLQMRALMLAQGQGSGSIIASDIRSNALEELTKRAQRAHFSGISIARWKSDELPVPQAHFDGVLVDAPCSCTGTWRRNPDMRWIDGIECVEDKATLQLDILRRSSKAVKDGGHLVYATCSLSPQENEQVVNAFLLNNTDFSLCTLTHPFTQQTHDMLTIWPFEADSDGMFVAKMQKR